MGHRPARSELRKSPLQDRFDRSPEEEPEPFGELEPDGFVEIEGEAIELDASPAEPSVAHEAEEPDSLGAPIASSYDEYIVASLREDRLSVNPGGTVTLEGHAAQQRSRNRGLPCPRRRMAGRSLGDRLPDSYPAASGRKRRGGAIHQARARTRDHGRGASYRCSRSLQTVRRSPV